jgi:hypothetical protein
MGKYISADKAVNHDLFTKKQIDGYAMPDSNSAVNYTFLKNGRIGNIYSYVVDDKGEVWWMFYITPSDYNNFKPTYIKHNYSDVTLPDLPDILQQIEDEIRQKEIEKKGLVAYYFEKYLPLIIIGGIVVASLPSLTKLFSNEKK